jgi:hypothetical protein
MRTLLILFVMLSYTSAYSVSKMPCDTVRAKEKIKKVEQNKRVKKQADPADADVRIQPNFMNLLY